MRDLTTRTYSTEPPKHCLNLQLASYAQRSLGMEYATHLQLIQSPTNQITESTKCPGVNPYLPAKPKPNHTVSTQSTRQRPYSYSRLMARIPLINGLSHPYQIQCLPVRQIFGISLAVPLLVVPVLEHYASCHYFPSLANPWSTVKVACRAGPVFHYYSLLV